jgi:cytochrome c
VVGRKAATAPGFPYTDALKASGLTWTPDTLDKLLQDPMKFVPGTAMPQSVPDPVQRADVIAYLETLKP